MKKIAVLGSTGSIGTQTLDIVRRSNKLKVTALSAASNIDLLEKQVREFKPNIVSVYYEAKARELKDRLKDSPVKVVSGMDGLIEAATEKKSEIVVTAMVGMIGIRPTIEAVKEGKDIALANKETLVTAGHLIMPLVKKMNVNLLPVDSEHSAIFQCLQGEDIRTIKKIILTASGGPFRGWRREDLTNIKPKEALKHPNWSMGQKISIDSATMVNKGLEVLEAHWLFDIEIDKIDVIVHPQSIVHSMVEYIDQSVIAQLGIADMGLPIQYALFYPDRMGINNKKPLDLIKMNQLIFEKPDMEVFRGLQLAYKAGQRGGSMPTAYNAANEWAVAKFLEEKIDFLSIERFIEESMEWHKSIEEPSLEEVLDTEIEIYEYLEGNYKR